MSVLVLGLSHHNADLALLERLAVPAETSHKVLRELVELEHVLEATVLSTCNRVEFYVHVSRFHPGYDELVEWLCGRAGDLALEVTAAMYGHVDNDAALHLFRVASGMDSMVIGEQQIAIQVKQAMEDARHEGTSRRMLQRLFRQAVRVSRRVRRETGIAEGASSMVEVGLTAATAALGHRPRSALVAGAGKIGSLTALQLGDDGVAVQVWNRSEDKAERLADRVGAVVHATLAAGLRDVDLVVATTGSPDPIITPDLLAGRSADNPIVLLDLAMPRNVDPACADIEGVKIVDIADVRDVAMAGHMGETLLPEAVELVAGEALRFQAWLSAMEVEPTIRAFRDRAEQVRQDELRRLGRRLTDLTEEQAATVEALTRGIINTLLHEPTIRLKELADAGGADVAVTALRELFNLDESDPS